MRIGCEISYIHPHLPIAVDGSGYFVHKIEMTRMKYMEERDRINLLINEDFHIDAGAFELSSPLFWGHDTIEKMNNWFKNVDRKVKDSTPLISHSNKTDGGGLHFHIDVEDPLKYEYIMEIMHRINNYPYLNWIFNHPIDDWSANNPNISFLKDFKNIGPVPSVVVSAYAMHNYKSNVIRIIEDEIKGRVEYRFFDMVKNDKEFEIISRFISEFHNNITKLNWLPITCEMPILTLEALKTVKYTNIIEKFETLVNKMGLTFSDFKPFIDRNLKKRLSYGIKYLV